MTKFVKYYRIWLEDSVEPEGGSWCYCGMDKNRYLHQLNFDYTGKEDQLDTIDNYLKWGYKIEEI